MSCSFKIQVNLLFKIKLVCISKSTLSEVVKRRLYFGGDETTQVLILSNDETLAVICFAFSFCKSRCADVAVCVMSRIHGAHPEASAVVWRCLALMDPGHATSKVSLQPGPGGGTKGRGLGLWPLSSL